MIKYSQNVIVKECLPMPIVNSRELLKKAYEGGYALGAFNVNNMEIIQGITEGAKLENAPLILQVSAGARKYAKHVYLMKLIEAAVEDTDNTRSSVIWTHGADFETCKSCIERRLHLRHDRRLALPV